MQNHRETTKSIYVGNVKIGGQNKVVIQSMTTTKTKDWEATLKQIEELARHGCEIVRVAVLDEDDARALRLITGLSPLPVVADIHFKWDLAIMAINHGASKIRINPGNIGSLDKIQLVVEACKTKGVPIRIGINAGSLPKHIFAKYGMTAEGLIEAAKENVKILEDLHFNNFLLSLKTTDPLMAIEAYTIASKLFKCPLHIGITESGSLLRGSVKSSYGLGKILESGIGDTMRVSLSCDPVNEVLVAKEILGIFDLSNKQYPKLISCPTCGRIQYNMLPIVDEIEKFLNVLEGKVKVAIMGCVVNGIGEAQDADITLVGSLKRGMIYIDKKLIKIVSEEEIVPELKKIILNYLEQRNIKN